MLVLPRAKEGDGEPGGGPSAGRRKGLPPGGLSTWLSPAGRPQRGPAGPGWALACAGCAPLARVRAAAAVCPRAYSPCPSPRRWKRGSSFALPQ